MALRTASRVDANQADIVRALRGIGCSIFHCHQLKNAFDILVGYRGRTFLMEIKVSPKEKLTPGEAEFKAQWRGSPYHIVCSPDEAIAIVTAPIPTTARNQPFTQPTCLCHTSTLP